MVTLARVMVSGVLAEVVNGLAWPTITGASLTLTWMVDVSRFTPAADNWTVYGPS